MENNMKLKEDFKDFITERLNESNSIVSNKKEYKDILNKRQSIINLIIKKIDDAELLEEYKKSECDMYYMQLEQAYITGFNDSYFINNNKNI